MERQITFSDVVNHSMETAAEKVSWLVALLATTYPVTHLTIQDWSAVVALATGVGGLILAGLNIYMTILKIRKMKVRN